jgi:hypothetical protein
MMSIAREVVRRGISASTKVCHSGSAVAVARRSLPLPASTVHRTIWSSLAGAANAAAPTGSMSGGSILASLKSENPYLDVVQYEHKNRTWSLQQVDYYSEALAIGFAENGLTIGDVVLSWLPAHFSETVG